MSADPYAAEQRQRQREAAHQRRQQCRREDLRHAARLLIPDHGMLVSLSQVATQVGLSRQAAGSLFHSVADLAVDLVSRTWRALIEATAPRAGDAPEDFCARLIEALRAEAPVHRVWQAVQCGLPPRHCQTLAEAEAFLALAVGEALREIRPAPVEQSAEIGGRVLAFARHAAYAAAAPDSRAEAFRIAAILPLLTAAPGAAAAAPAPQPARHGPASRPAAARRAPEAKPRAAPASADTPGLPPLPGLPGLPGLPALPAAPAPPRPAPVWAMPARHGQDPPARAA